MDTAFMFSVLNEQEKEVVMDMEEKKYKPGDWVIK